MAEPDKISYRLMIETLTYQVRDLSADTNNVAFTLHAEDRMFERGISFGVALDVLRTGDISLEGTDKKGNNVVKASKQRLGGRGVGVITAIVTPQKKLRLITVMWNDTK